MAGTRPSVGVTGEAWAPAPLELADNAKRNASGKRTASSFSRSRAATASRCCRRSPLTPSESMLARLTAAVALLIGSCRRAVGAIGAVAITAGGLVVGESYLVVEASPRCLAIVRAPLFMPALRLLVAALAGSSGTSARSCTSTRKASAAQRRRVAFERTAGDRHGA